MLTIANVPTADGYSDALTLGPVALAEQITYLVANAAAVVELAPLVKSGTQQDWGPELLIPPSSGTFVHAGGIRFRSAVAGSPAQVIAQLSQPGDPIPAGSTPFTDFLTAAGAINPAGVTDWADLSGYGAWTRDSADAPTYVLTVPANVTGVLNAGMRIKWTQAAVTGYGIITAVGAFTGGATKVTLFAGAGYSVTAGTIAGIAYATTKAPLGFPPDPTAWTVITQDNTNRSQAAPVLGTWYNPGALGIVIPIGIWRVDYEAALLAWLATGAAGAGSVDGVIDLESTLSTGAATESDPDFTAYFFLESGADGFIIPVVPVKKAKVLAVAAKTQYYLNVRITQASAAPTQVSLWNGKQRLQLRAESAYL